ncbi:MAG: hypothetical protein LBC12_00515 [Nitrososphaerota archaeon]|jgi:hypothetical protein|nr:hypothetical protein [Nitrososphaerota archaeon]
MDVAEFTLEPLRLCVRVANVNGNHSSHKRTKTCCACGVRFVLKSGSGPRRKYCYTCAPFNAHYRDYLKIKSLLNKNSANSVFPTNNSNAGSVSSDVSSEEEAGEVNK